MEDGAGERRAKREAREIGRTRRKAFLWPLSNQLLRGGFQKGFFHKRSLKL